MFGSHWCSSGGFSPDAVKVKALVITDAEGNGCGCGGLLRVLWGFVG